MMPKLRAVGADEKPASAPPKSMSEATERSRREFLVRARLQIATAIDAGVPAHALGRLIAEAERLDAEVRRLDALDQEEGGGVAQAHDGSFDATAI